MILIMIKIILIQMMFWNFNRTKFFKSIFLDKYFMIQKNLHIWKIIIFYFHFDNVNILFYHLNHSVVTTFCITSILSFLFWKTILFQKNRFHFEKILYSKYILLKLEFQFRCIKVLIWTLILWSMIWLILT